MTKNTRPAWVDEIEPTYDGPVGRAWRLALPDMSDDWRGQVTLDSNFVVFAPQAHPMWSWHIIFAVSLRDVEGQDQTPYKEYKEATHELMVWAIDPNHLAPDPRAWPAPGSKDLHLLRPPDCVVQFHVESDDHAVKVVDLCAKACTTGLLVPDSDYALTWRASIRATAQHFRDGVHE